MKRIFILLLAMCSMSTFVRAAQEPVGLTVGIVDPEAAGNGHPRTPIIVPSASIDDHTFYLGSHPNYVLQLVDPDDETIVFYETDFLSGANSIVLPSTLIGTYEVRLLWGNWYFYGIINL